MYWGEPKGDAFIESPTYTFALAIAVIVLIVLFAMPFATPGDSVYIWAETAAKALLPALEV